MVAATHSCPWDDADLKKWSEPSTWPSGQIPKENDAVHIPKDLKVILDTTVPRFLTITIDGILVWGNLDGIRIETSYILVNGEFHIGSEDCRFEKTADIFLYGKSNDKEQVEGFGRKFIGANTGGKIEFHGKEKKSWTKLVETIRPALPGPCGCVYDSVEQTVKRRNGIYLNVWNADGTLFKLESFDMQSSRVANSLNDIVEMMKSFPDGKIFSMSIYKTIGVVTQHYEQFFKLMEDLGAKQIRHVGEFDPYVFIGETGKVDCIMEQHTPRRAGYLGPVEALVKFGLGDLVFITYSRTEPNTKNEISRFRALNRDAAYPKLSFLHDVSTWEVGDEVIVASTDFEWRQAEIRTIIPCRECSPNQIRVDGDFLYNHFGEVTHGVDERAEVGLLTRNIRLDAEMQPDCYHFTEKEEYNCKMFKRDTYGGHVKFVRDSWARVEGVQLTHMGQQSVLATYPLHYHLADNVKGQYLRNNVIRDSNSRCVTIHGTDFLEVSNNVCAYHLGHGIFLEDSAEQNNTIHRNLIIGTQYGTLLFTDMDVDMCKNRAWCGLLSSYWITHPRNIFTENVAAGSDSFGMVLAFADRPLGPSFQRQVERGLYEDMSTRYIPILEFARNIMHGNKHGGLWFDNRLSYGQIDMNKWVPENGKLGLNMYTPSDPPNANGTLVEAYMSGLTMYKNDERNSWVRCGNIVITNSSFADSPVSYVAAHSGDDPTSCDVRNSLFIGETDNKGEAWTYFFNTPEFQHLPKSQRPSHRFDRSISQNRPDMTISAVQFYQGPVYLDNCYFDKYKTWYYNDSFIDAYGIRPKRPATAFHFHPANHYPMVPTNGVRNLRFGYCDGVDNSFRVMDGNASTPYWTVLDGTNNINFRDYDGTLTGRADVQIVDNRPFFTTDRCRPMDDWGLAICPYKYFMLVVRGGTGVLQNKYKGKSPVFIRRDDSPEDVYRQKGMVGHKFTLMVSKSYTVFFNSTLGESPRDVQFKARFGLEKDDIVRIAVCFPKSTTKFTIYSKIPRLDPKRYLSPVQVGSLEEVDQDKTMTAWYWNQTTGYLYFKMSSPMEMNDPDQKCPGNECLAWDIRRDDGDNGPAICDTPVIPFYVKDRNARVKPPRCLEPASPVGLGAPIEMGYQPPTHAPGTCGYSAASVSLLCATIFISFGALILTSSPVF
ncbi:hypothetical protein RRG08_043869 [Elysia crispata]|uniref:G8 domain-containing protein n=1 Tax=Elysia crispata TaxID=231223 RepID=A0AAE0XUB6_9GAST|nr:hypothetical protein RRG08_043869 [Elysia crispata]